MNERIIDLYEQASAFASEEENPTKSYKDRVLIKFAELIVRECAKCSSDDKDVYRMYEHFGVES